LATRTRCRRTSRTCAGGRATSTASSRCSSGRATYPRARSRIFWRRSPTSCGSRAPAISSVTAEARSLVAVEATARLAAVVARAVALLDAARRTVLLATRRRVDRRADHEGEVDPGEIHEAERSERMAERLLRGEVDLLERGIALVDEEGRLAPERAEQPIRDEALDLLLHQDRPLADALRELDQARSRRGRFFLCPAALLDASCDVLVGPALRCPHLFRARVPESHGEPVMRRVQCDLATHEARTHHADPFQLVDLQRCLPAVSLSTRAARSSSARARRSTLPTVLFGRSDRNSISARILKRASDEPQGVRSSSVLTE